MSPVDIALNLLAALDASTDPVMDHVIKRTIEALDPDAVEAAVAVRMRER